MPVKFKLSLKIPPGVSQNSSADLLLLKDVTALLQAQPARPSDAFRGSTLTYDGDRLQLVVTGKNLLNPRPMPVPGRYDVIGAPRIVAGDRNAFIFEIPAWAPLDHPLIGRKLGFIIRDGNRAIEQKIKVTDHRLLSQENSVGETDDH